MALTQKHRSSIYLHLTPIIGEEEAEALLSHFPARDLDEPVTKEFLRAEVAGVGTEIAELRGELHAGLSGLRGDLRTEISGLRDELHSEISGLRDELRTEITGLRGELHSEISGLRGELRTEITGLRGELHSEVAGLESRMNEKFRQQTIWIASAMTVGMGLAASIAQLF